MYCIRQPYLTLVYATGSFEETKYGAAIEAIINIVVSAILVNFLGIEGVVIGTFIANTFRTIQFAWFVSKKILNRSISEIVFRLLWVSLIVVTVVFADFLTKKAVSFEISWIGWLFEAITVFVISCTVALFMSFLFYGNDMKELFRIGLSIIKKRV